MREVAASRLIEMRAQLAPAVEAQRPKPTYTICSLAHRCDLRDHRA
jgi:hypothetical protein